MLIGNRNVQGFTIVELLIVIVVIAILAAITIVAFNGIQNRAAESTIKSDLSQVKKKLEIAKVDSGHYPYTVGEMPGGFTFTKQAYDLNANNIYYCADRENARFALGVRSKSLKGYILTNDTLLENIGINGPSTCDAIDKEWVNDATTVALQGYTGTPSFVWTPSWSWTQ